MEEQITLKEKTLKNKLLPIVLMLFNITFFFYLLPIDIAEEYSIFFAVLGGFATLILSFWIFFDVTPKLVDKFPIFMGIFGISTLFIFGYFFILKTANFASNELRDYGVSTEAKIIDRTKIYGKRGRSSQSIVVMFLATSNKRFDASILVSENYYDNLQKGMIIPIKYSSKHPNIAEIDFAKLRIR